MQARRGAKRGRVKIHHFSVKVIRGNVQQSAGAPVESETHSMFLVPACDSSEAIMGNEGARLGLLLHSCCVCTNVYPSAPIHSEMIGVSAYLCSPLQSRTSIQPQAQFRSIFSLSVSLLHHANWWQQRVSRLGCTDRLVVTVHGTVGLI